MFDRSHACKMAAALHFPSYRHAQNTCPLRRTQDPNRGHDAAFDMVGHGVARYRQGRLG